MDMVIFLYGADSYRRQKKLRELILEYQKKNSAFSEKFFDLENPDDFFGLKELFTQVFMFSQKKLMVLKNISAACENEIDDLTNLIKSVLKSSDDILIISDENVPVKKFSFLLGKSVVSQKFKNMDSAKREFFITKEAKNRNIELTQKAIKFMARTLKEGSWEIINELDKIQFLKEDDKKFDAEDLEKIFFYSEPTEIFRFINNVFKTGRLAQKLHDLELIFLNREEPAKIFNIMAGGKFLTFEQITRLADYDALVKSGKIDYDMVLLDIALLNAG
ncbi:MAG: hypothetical protein QMD86_00960 [Patescibacteria group bacterium]|nr:hypothetical protein [Patescibacteria group bacterium]